MKVLVPWDLNTLRNVSVALVQSDPEVKGFLFVCLLFKLRKGTFWVRKWLQWFGRKPMWKIWSNYKVLRGSGVIWR